jgi:hypothetical protein
MSTFIVRLFESEGAGIRGRVRHVGSGEEALFASKEELVAFFEAMNFVRTASASARQGSGARSSTPKVILTPQGPGPVPEK